MFVLFVFAIVADVADMVTVIINVAVNSNGESRVKFQ